VDIFPGDRPKNSEVQAGTLMAPTTKEPDSLTSGQANGEAALPGAKPQPAAAEIPVTVNGARTVEGTDKREPFSETTKTVLVLPKGAVIRLSSVVAPGQLLFLTNEKTKKEVVCQVVKAKSHSGASGYVELEFTEPAPGFWGLRFSGSSLQASAPGVAKPAASSPASPAKSLEEKLAEVKAKSPAAPAVSSLKPVEDKPAPTLAPAQPLAAIPAAGPKESKTAPSVSAQPPANGVKIPTLSEFLTHGAAGPELKGPERAKSENGAKNVGGNAQEGKRQQTTQPAELPKPACETEKQESLSSLLVPQENPAPGTSTFDFGGLDEVKIPAWLEPLARNSASSPVAHEAKTPLAMDLDGSLPEAKLSETKSSGISLSTPENGEETETESLEAFSELSAAKHEEEVTLPGEGPAPNFGSSLAFGAKSAAEARAEGSGKGLQFGLVAAGLLLVAGGGWYWYSNQPKDVSANAVAPYQPQFATFSSASNASSVPAPTNTDAGNSGSSSGANRNSVNPASVPAANVPAGSSANSTLKSLAPAGASTQRSLPVEVLAEQPAAEKAKKPSLGHVRLAAPTVNKRATALDSGSASEEFALSGSVAGGDVAGDDPSHLSLFASKGKPAAPVPVGGDVKQARLISAVSPVYPQLARTQRMSGNVIVDALIDTNGRVSTMKVLSGPALLHQSAMDALRQWKYEPATLNGQPMAMHLTVTIQFKLQ
jgi:TonB family protein